MAMTAEEKKEIKQAVLDEIKSESSDITEIETVSSLDGLTGLPAMQGEKLVTAPLSLLSKPATDAATVANAAAKTANTAADTANKAADKADTATTKANTAASSATSAANAANAAAENINSFDDRIKLAMKGASARFDGFVDGVTISFLSVTANITGIVYDTRNKAFLARTIDSGRVIYCNNWAIDNNVYSADMFMDETRSTPHKDKVYMCGASLYVWSDEEDNLVEVSGSGSGSGFYNVTNEQPLDEGKYYDKDTAIAALENADIKDENKLGMILTFEKSAGVWVDYRFVVSSVDKFLTPASWEEYGGGTIKAITLNGDEVKPDENGIVALKIDQIAVDESLDDESTNPVQNKVVTAKVNEISDAAIGGVEVIESDDKNTLNILNKKGGIIASTEFSGGGGGGGTSTASRIVLTATLDKAQVKEGGTAQLTYSYNHVNADGDNDGIKADITVTISRGTTQTYQVTTKNVSAGTYTLDVSEYLLVGTTDIYVKAVATTEDGTRQTKQAYTSINVITLSLTSSYNLGSTIANGGYKNSDTIEIPFTITGSGTKDVSMYVDGAENPVSQTINKSGTVNGSFTIKGSTLTAGRHTIQLVAERNGLKSDSIYMDVLKAGQNVPFVGIKYTDKSGTILTTTHLTPTLQAYQYEQMSFNFVAYDPNTTPAQVEVYLNDVLKNTINAPRSMQTYTNRFTEQGAQKLVLKVGTKSYTLNINVAESSVNLSEAIYGLLAKLDAAGRSNTENDPAQWTSRGLSTEFSGFDWSSNGWTGESLKLTNGAKAVIDFQPFKTDIKATGLTIEITMKVSNIMSRSANVVKCIDGGKGLLITAEEASFKTGQSVTYTNEDDEQVTREIKLGTNFVSDKWIKIALAISTKDNNRLMQLFVNGNRTGADIYDTSFNFAQDNPQSLSIDSADADVEVKTIRIYSRALSDDEELDNNTVDAETSDAMMALFDENDILGETGEVDIDKIRAKGKGVLRIVRKNKLDDVYAENNKKTDFVADVYFYSPYGKEYDFVLKDCYIRIQGTSSTKYPSKNIRIYCAKGGETLSFTIGGVVDPLGKNRYCMRPGAIPMNLFCCKSDYSDSSMSLNTGGAKLFNDIFKELGLFTPPQRYQYEHGGKQTSAINVRTAIDGIPIDIFCAETEDGESEYYGQYNFNNEKSKSETLFGMTGVDGYTPEMPMTFEMLNNGAAMCLFKTTSDTQVEQEFDDGAETNYPDDVKWAGLTSAQQAAVKRLYGWIRDCVPTGANANNIASFKSSKFVNEIDQYFDKDFILTYYLWTDYFLSVDQRAKNMMLRTWDGKVWYLTYYDGDTQLGKRNDCFLVYLYTTDRDTYDAEASKYAFEGRESWLWNLVLANLQDDLKRCAANLRQVMTNERVLAMFNTEQSGHWSDRAFNKSGEIKYIRPAVQEMYGKVWPFIYALQGSNTSHREYFIKNRFALLDAKWGTSNFTSDNVDMYLSRTTSDEEDVVKITANEVYAFGYGTNNSPNIANTGIVKEGDVATLDITGAYTVNDPIRMYGASRMKILDMTGAADHLKNGFDLGKCDVLRELNLQSSGSGSTGWWLVLNACKSLRRLNVRNQAQAKTGSNTSKELDLSNQTKLEYLDARGTQVESVNFAQGAPLTTAYLPRTLTTLKLEYLSKLMPTRLYIESFANVNTFIFSGCPNLDWQSLLDKCTNVKRIRVTGIDMDGDGSLLDKYITAGGVDADGNYTDTCAFVGSYRLTRFVDDATYAAYVAHFPELNITLPEYTTIKFDDSVSDSANISNLDNQTGYDFDKAFVMSGHVAKIDGKRHRVLTKKTGSGEVTVCQLHDKNSNYFADADDVSKATAAVLTGAMGDVMLHEPHYWYKGVNDYLNKAKYAHYSSNDNCPKKAESVNIKLSDMKVKKGYAIRSSVDYTTVAEAEAPMTNDSYVTVDIKGYKQVRYPSLPSALYGAIMLNAEGKVVKRMKATSDSGIREGCYCFTSIPDDAVTLVFTIANSAPFDYVLLTKSDKVEAIEPDWVEHMECLVGVYEALLRDDFLYSISGVQSTASVTCPDFKVYARNRGKGYQLIDWEMHKDIANLFFAKYGERDSQGTCGPGTHTNGRATGASDATGMQDTKPTAKDGDTPPAVKDGYYPNANAYVLKNEDDETRTAIGSPVCMGYENLYGNKAEWMEVEYNKTTVDYIWRSMMPDGSERQIQGIKQQGDLYPKNVIHGRFMDIVTAQSGGSQTSYYYDNFYQSGSTARVVFRSYGYANAYGGVSFAGSYDDSAHVGAHIGSRLAFRGVIKVATSVSAFIAIQAVA